MAKGLREGGRGARDPAEKAGPPPTIVDAGPVGGGRGAPPADDSAVFRAMVREMMDDRDKAREARMEAHEASIARSLSKLDTMPTQVTLVWVIIGAAVGAIILILGIMQFARSEFWGASQFTASTYEQAHEAKETADKAANDVSDLKRRFEQTNRNLETLNESIKQLSETAHREKTDVQGQVPKP